MNRHDCLGPEQRCLGALWGAVTGDALGVPVEFASRQIRKSDPVSGMRGFGTHRQPPGTWSDDSSLLLCTVDSLVETGFDTSHLGKRFAAWRREEIWTPRGRVFDIGITTSRALDRIESGVAAEFAGGDDQFSNGNGSLMRILPIGIHSAEAPTRELLDRTHRVSAITHRHPRSQMACGLYVLVLRELLTGAPPDEAFVRGLKAFRDYYEMDPWWGVEMEHFQSILDGNVAALTESANESGGYVMHTLTASLWCLLTTPSYRDCVLKVVNLGGDTDTTACVAGGLAGAAYGIESVPKDWIELLARKDDLATLFASFVSKLRTSQARQS